MDNATAWLIRLLAAHLLTDFVLQPRKWVTARQEKHLKAREFWWHISLTTLVSAWFTGFNTWWVPVVIFTSHGLIDWWKSWRPDNILYFVIDQLLHLLVIFIIWQIKFAGAFWLPELLGTYTLNPNLWMIGTAVIALTSPVGIVIGMLTQSFRAKIEDYGQQSLDNGGKWIGILERLIVFFLVMVEQYDAIGLLIAAKSIIRMKEDAQKMSEYVLIGTLLSVSVAMLVGFIVSKLM